MYSPTSGLSCPIDFNFPFTPYTIQQQLMQELYDVLENKQIGIFESPTGTGKSLTLTCAALKWLDDHEQLVRKELVARLEKMQIEVLKLEKESQEVTDWITMHSKTSQQRHELLKLRELKKLLDEFEENLNEIRKKQKTLKQTRSKGVKINKIEENDVADIEDNLIYSLEDSDSMTDSNFTFAQKCEKYRDVQIFFCSRTHTQLSQVVNEIKRTAYGERVRCVSLASRQQLCIHNQLRKLSNTALINEKCLDMSKDNKPNISKTTSCDTNGCVQKKSKVSQTSASIMKCEFKTQALVQELTEMSLVDVMDIEDLVSEGEKLNACPYYAARSATELAQIVMLPYQILLHKRTRQQTGINLEGSIIIIDEAHNLLDTISQMHSSELNLQQLQNSQQQILAYKMKYASRFSSSNLLSINQLLFVIKRLVKILQAPNCKEGTKTHTFRMLSTCELMSEGDFFNIDLYQLLNFCENVRFAQKLQGFVKRASAEPNPNENKPPSSSKLATLDLLQRLQKNHIEKQQNPKNKLKDLNPNPEMQQQSTKDKIVYPPTSPIRSLLSFLEAFCEKADDGRILINIAEKSSKNYEHETGYKYILLNPGIHFQDIVKEARAIIVAGGTMQPTAELTEQLFSSCPERVKLRFYDHVVPDDAVLPFVVTKSPSGKNLCFNYAQRSSCDMLMDLCTILENLCNVVPAGLVCFLPSYDYLDVVFNHLQKSGAMQRISNKKRVFKEPRNIINNNGIGVTSPTVEKILNDYSKAIKHNQGGALLLSVVGAKLSEGLNFADDLGRGVIVVGLPFPNRNSPELQERMSYLDTTLGPGSGSEYYENLCMKAVNQCIGRSVRHIKDYACVYLLDERYARDNIKRKLPQWISRHLKVATTYGQVQGGTAKFFKQKKV